MNLISNKNSWDTLKETFQNFYNDPTLIPKFFNYKQTLFDNDYLPTVVQVDTLGDNDNYFDFGRYYQSDLKIILNSTVTIFPERMYLTLANYYNSYIREIEFKHNATELQNFEIEMYDSTTDYYVITRFFSRFSTIYVPEGLKQTYIDFFSNKYYPLTSEQEDQIVEVSSNAVS